MREVEVERERERERERESSAVWSHGRDRIVGTGAGWRTLVYDSETGTLLHTLATPATHLGAAAASSRVQVCGPPVPSPYPSRISESHIRVAHLSRISESHFRVSLPAAPSPSPPPPPPCLRCGARLKRLGAADAAGAVQPRRRDGALRRRALGPPRAGPGEGERGWMVSWRGGKCWRRRVET